MHYCNFILKVHQPEFNGIHVPAEGNEHILFLYIEQWMPQTFAVFSKPFDNFVRQLEPADTAISFAIWRSRETKPIRLLYKHRDMSFALPKPPVIIPATEASKAEHRVVPRVQK